MILRRTLALAFLLALGAATIVALPGSAGAVAGKRKCTSFASQKAAQKYFVGHGGSQSNDVAGLDSDGDGLVCPFYGQVVCVDYPEHLTKAETRAEEKAAEEAAESKSKFRGMDCASPFIEVQLKEVAAGEDPVVA